jgi:hypothetical protein
VTTVNMEIPSKKWRLDDLVKAESRLRCLRKEILSLPLVVQAKQAKVELLALMNDPAVVSTVQREVTKAVEPLADVRWERGAPLCGVFVFKNGSNGKQVAELLEARLPDGVFNVIGFQVGAVVGSGRQMLGFMADRPNDRPDDASAYPLTV